MHLRSFVTQCAGSLLLAGVAAATPITSIWVGGSGNWSDATKWVTPPGNPAAGYQVLIDNLNPVSSSVLVDIVTPLLNNTAVDAGDTVTVGQTLNAGTMRSFGNVTVNGTGTLNSDAGGFVQDFSTATTTVLSGGQFVDQGSYSQGNGSTSVAGTLSTSLFHVTGGSVTAADGGVISVGAGGFTQDQAVTTVINSTGQLQVLGAYAQGNGSTAVNGSLSAALLHVTGGSVTVNSGGSVLLGAGGYTQGTAGTTTTIAAGGQVTVTGGNYSQEIGTTTTLDGTLTATTINNSGTLQGTGKTNASLIDLGTLSPGDSAVGTFTVNGTYSQSGFLNIDLASPGINDFVNVLGSASLGGTLAVDELGGFIPTIGSTFHIMAFTSRTGAFTNIMDAGLSAGRFWQPIYTSTDVFLTLESTQATPEPGALGTIVMGLALLAGVSRRRGRKLAM